MEAGWIDTAVVSEGRQDLQQRGVTVSRVEEIRNRGKSRFLVSSAVAEFNRAVQGEGGRIGVVATPCQAQALAKMRQKPLPSKDHLIDKLQLVIGLFCGWTLAWRPFRERLAREIDPAEVIGMDIPAGKGVVEVYTGRKTLVLPMEELESVIRPACRYCLDSTAEFADLSVGSARLPEGWQETRTWNQVIVRSARGMELLERAREKGMLEFRAVPPGTLEELKQAAREKKMAARERIKEKGRAAEGLVYQKTDRPANP